MEQRTWTNERQTNYLTHTPAHKTAPGAEELIVTVVSPEITETLRQLRRQKLSKKEKRALARAAVRDDVAKQMKDVAVWQFENILSLAHAWVTFIDVKGMGCRLMREEGVHYSRVSRRHEVGFYGEMPFDVVTLKLRLSDLRKYSVAMRKLRRLAIEGGFEGYPELCASVINKDN